MVYKKALMLLGLTVVFLGGCSNESAEEQIYGHLEEAVDLEQSFIDQQSEISDLEKREQEIYNEIVALTEDEMEQVKTLSDEALSILDEKETKMDAEKESIDSAKEEFDNITSVTEELEEENTSAEAEELISVMNERYDTYNSLYESYKIAIDEDRKLYQLMQTEDVTEEEIKKQINTVNEKYEQILADNKSFNSKTEEYNQAKQDFYEATDLQIEYE